MLQSVSIFLLYKLKKYGQHKILHCILANAAENRYFTKRYNIMVYVTEM